jgi:hypothetical protein
LNDNCLVICTKYMIIKLVLSIFLLPTSEEAG